MIIKLGGKRGCSLIIPPTYWGIIRDILFWPLFFNQLNNSLNLRTNTRTTDSQDQVIRHRYRTRSQARKMAEETNARIERLEKQSQESRAQMTE